MQRQSIKIYTVLFPFSSYFVASIWVLKYGVPWKARRLKLKEADTSDDDDDDCDDYIYICVFV